MARGSSTPPPPAAQRPLAPPGREQQQARLGEESVRPALEAKLGGRLPVVGRRLEAQSKVGDQPVAL